MTQKTYAQGGDMPPPLPSGFYGEVAFDGEPVVPGTPITVMLDGVNYINTTTFAAEGKTVYKVQLPGDIPTTSQIEGGTDGQPIRFWIDGFQARSAATWRSGEYVNLNLNVFTASPPTAEFAPSKQFNPAYIHNGATVIDSSPVYNDSASYTADKLLDGTSSAFRTADVVNSYVVIDLGGDSTHVIDTAVLEANSTYALKAFEIQVSNQTPSPSDFVTVYAGVFTENTVSPYRQTFTFPPTQARYVRLVAQSNHGNASYTQITEFSVLTRQHDGGRVSPFEGYPASVAGVSSDGSNDMGSNAIDERPSSYWYPELGGIAGEHFIIDLGGNDIERINRVDLLSSGGARHLNSFEVQVSTTVTDDIAFTSVYSGVITNTGELETITFPTVSARYVRLLIHSNHGDTNYVYVNTFHPYSEDGRNVGRAEAANAQIVDYASADNATSYRPENLIDSALVNNAWRSERYQLTDQHITLALTRGETHLINRVRLSNLGGASAAKEFVISISNNGYDAADFSQIYAGSLPDVAGSYDFVFPPVSAKYVRVDYLNNHGDTNYLQTQRIEVFAADEGGATVPFDNLTLDANQDVSEWHWTFGDGNASAEEHPVHTYAAPGTYNVTLIVTDTAGFTSTVTHPYTVLAAEPISITYPTPVEEGANVVYDIVSDTPLDNIWSYEWQSPLPGAAQTAASSGYKFPDNGMYTVTVTTTDLRDLMSEATAIVSVVNVTPTISSHNDLDVVWGQPWGVRTTVSDQGTVDRPLLACEWDLGDGYTTVITDTCTGNIRIPYSYTVPGIYTATLTVTDKEGASVTDALTTTVRQRESGLIVFGATSVTDTTAELVAVVYDGYDFGEKLVDQLIEFSWDGGILTGTTDADGVAKVIAPFIPGEAVTMTVTYPESQFYLSDVVSKAIKVAPTVPRGDVVFAIDESGSMGGVQQAVRDNIETIARLLGTIVDFQFGLVGYGHGEVTAPGGAGRLLSPLTGDIDAYADALDLLVTSGGTEPGFNATVFSMSDALAFRTGSGVCIVLATDEEGSANINADAPETLDDAVLALELRNAGFFAITHPGSTDYAREGGLTDQANGTHYSLTDFVTNPGETLAVLVEQCSALIFENVPPELAITLTDGHEKLTPGESMTYVMTATNRSIQDATGVAITQILPDGIEVAAVSDGGTVVADNLVTWPLISLDSGQTVTRSVQVTLTQAITLETISSTVNIFDDGANGAEIDLQNNTSTDSVGVVEATAVNVNQQSLSYTIPDSVWWAVLAIAITAFVAVLWRQSNRVIALPTMTWQPTPTHLSRLILPLLLAIALIVALIGLSEAAGVAVTGEHPLHTTLNITAEPTTEGWALLSLPRVPSSTVPADLFASISGQFDTAWTYDQCDEDDPWKMYDPADAAASDMTSVDHKQGIWVQASNPFTLTVTGEIPTDTDIPLCQGWNLIGYPFSFEQPIEEALATIAGDYLRLYEFDPGSPTQTPWLVWDAAAPDWANDVTTLKPGRGYWLLATKDTTVTIDNTLPTAEITSPTPDRTYSSMTNVRVRITGDNIANWTLDLIAADGSSSFIANGTELANNLFVGAFYPNLYAAGNYTLTLRVTDTFGRTVTDLVPVTLSPTNNQLIADIITPATDDILREPTPIIAAIAGDVTEWVLTSESATATTILNTGTTTVTNAAIGTFTPVFGADGTYTVTLVVTGTNGTASNDQIVFTTAVVELPTAALSSPADGDTISRISDIIGTASSPSLDDWTLTYQTDGDSNQYILATGTTPVINGVLGQFNPLLFPDGQVTVRLYVNDTVGNQATDTLTVSSIQPVIGAPPETAIVSPLNGTIITDSTDVVGTVVSADLVEWKLQYAIDDPNPVWTTVTTGTTSVLTQTVGTLDPTLMFNGINLVRLIGTDTAGQTVGSQISVVVDNQRKIGNFSLSFVDVNIPVSGIPIQIVRTYDSRDRRSNDFGVGWSIDVRDINVQESKELGKGWQMTTGGGFIPQYCMETLEPHTVSIRAGDQVFKFYPEASPRCSTLYPHRFVDIVFKPFPGTNGELVALGGADAIVLGGPGGGDIELVDYDIETLDPSRYQLTTLDGRELIIDEVNGLESLTDANGNTLTIDDNGITHSSGTAITFERDLQGRITSITEPEGQTVNYTYDAAGDLIAVDDQAADTTTFGYDDHYLIDIFGPNGVRFVRNEFDDDGRLVKTTDADGNELALAHDLDAKLTSLTDRLGYASSFEYDDDGNVTRQVDENGNETISTFDANGNVVSRTDALGNTYAYTYDDNDNRLTETDPLGNTITRTFDANGNELTMTDPLGNVTTFTYDAANNKLTETDALGNQTRYAYDANGNEIRVTDAENQAWSRSYDANGNLTSLTEPNGSSTTYTYDRNGLLLTETVRRAPAPGQSIVREITSYRYNERGQLIEITYPDGTVSAAELNELGLPTEATDALGRTQISAFDNSANLLSEVRPDGSERTLDYDPEGQVTKMVGFSGREVEFAYDPVGQINELVHTDSDGNPFTYSLTWDAVGRIASRTDGNGSTLAYTYDALNRVTAVTNAIGQISTFDYDAAGNMITQTNPAGNVTAHEYDAANRRIRTVFADGSQELFEYDKVGRMIKEIDQSGYATEYDYDHAGNLLSVTDALTQTTSYDYDEVGNLVGIIDASGNETTWRRDSQGRVISRTLPLGQAESFWHDAVGNVITHTDFNGEVTTFGYDSLDRTIRETSGSTTRTYAYGNNDRRTSAADATGATTYVYDAADRLQSETKPDGTTLTYTYDGVGNVTSVSGPAGTINHSYDALYRLITTTDPDGGVTTYTYDASGNLASTTLPNGTSTAYTYDVLNRLTLIEQKAANGSVIESYAYTLGAAGERLKLTEGNGRTVDYTYDRLYRLTSETIVDPGNVTLNYIYTYDAVGNRTTKGMNGDITLYTYDANDRLLTESDGTTTTTYTWDENGNMLAADDGTETTTYAYSDRDELLEVVTPDETLTYVYDINSMKIEERTNGALTARYVIDHNTPYSVILREIDGAGNIIDYVHGHDLISQKRGGAIAYFHYDGQTSTRLLSDSGGSVTDRFDYDAWGNLLGRTGSTETDFMYAGEQYDPNLGFYYLRARYMDTTVGRFTSMDKYIGVPFDPISLHKYTYANNDPVRFVDPTGRFGLASISVSISISVNIQSAYAQSMFGLLAKSLEISRTILEPAFTMRNIALTGMFSGHPALFEVYVMMEQAARDDIVFGLKQISLAIINSYDSFIKNITLGAVKIKIGLVKNTKWLIDTKLSTLFDRYNSLSSGNAGEKDLLFFLKFNKEAAGVLKIYETWKTTLVKGISGDASAPEVLAEAAKAFAKQFWK